MVPKTTMLALNPNFDGAHQKLARGQQAGQKASNG
jgi:hypothetical protein